MSRAAQTTHVALRIAAGLFFLMHGGQKMLGWFGGFMGQPGATAPLMSQMGLAGVLELVGGAMLVLGLLTRPVAFLLAGEMAVAYFQAHFPRGFWPIQNQGEAAALYSLIFLFFAGNGDGGFSLDSLIRNRRRPAATERPEPQAVPAPDAEPDYVPDRRRVRRAG